MRIAVSLLPKTALVDTGVFLRFLGERSDEPKSIACNAFCKAMLDNHREIFVAAPTIAEITRWKGTKLPRARGITVVAFDERAAELLGIKGPVNTITEMMKETGESRNCIRYDFLIAACAVRAHADVLVSLDKDLPKICNHMSISCRKPEEYEEVSLLKLASPPSLPAS
jgi:predicted nucleic acid-binding protein